ncbi:DUF4145 domain-containing protein [Limosilactobacillus reuteri]|uniref:DUF4145 domain-containing protein n=1 Tax=Limosilactobacillus reuteri TaxID=1598 RepID=UPI002551D3EC|nr:DUF4145 domain-containing protein [Limosilactobacillus reuteri]MDL2056796.1 DUF4145 domain-containing protein [Limosilactobacillus reuteri]
METVSWHMSMGVGNYVQTEFLLPRFCPNCGNGNNPSTTQQGYKLFEDYGIFFLIHTCPVCRKFHLTTQKIYKDSSNKPTELLTLYPKGSLRKFSTLIEELSPRFVDSYHQAEKAEVASSYDLAISGYRTALEILIKDYAKEYSGESVDQISSLNLHRAISHYLNNDPSSLVSADVVHFIGNDATHWKRPENYDSQKSLIQVKQYFEIFLSIIKTRLMVNNPPVSR